MMWQELQKVGLSEYLTEPRVAARKITTRPAMIIGTVTVHRPMLNALMFSMPLFVVVFVFVVFVVKVRFAGQPGPVQRIDVRIERHPVAVPDQDRQAGEDRFQ